MMVLDLELDFDMLGVEWGGEGRYNWGWRRAAAIAMI